MKSILHRQYDQHIESRKHIVDLSIEQVLRIPSVFFQVHQMDDDTFVLHWIVTLELSDVVRRLNDYVAAHDLEHLSVDQLFDDKKVCLYLQEGCRRGSCALSHGDMQTIWNAVEDVKAISRTKPFGLDGYDFRFVVYGESERAYSCWCVLPREWISLQPVIEMMIAHAGLDDDLYGVLGVG